jgi:DUF4097 and DUF4098 domain-containing protein YvlB
MTIFWKQTVYLLLAICCPSVIAVGQQTGAYQKQKIEIGSKVSIDNDYGSITVRGWDKDFIEAIAVNTNTSKTVPVFIKEDSASETSITIDSQREKPGKAKISLEIKLPRFVQLQPIYNGINDISVFDINGTADLKTDSGEITVNQIGSLQARSENGSVTVKGVNGSINIQTGTGNIVIEEIGSKEITTAVSLIEITTGNGNVKIHNVKDDVRIVAINSKINLDCVKGDVSIRDTSSQILILNVGGDVEVSTSNGRANFVGAIRSDGRYRLKTLSGVVLMAIPDSIGFSALLTSYKGRIETDFNLQGGSQSSSRKTISRVAGRFGDGSARIELDSFEGRVQLSKIAPEAIQQCSEVKTNE